jgi:ATP-dependent 26S proteasome regulatory subunit
MGNFSAKDVALPPADDPIEALRSALQFSPENLPLRQHLANSLMGLARYGEAEAEYREALRLAPQDKSLRIGLATAYSQQSKYSQALVILEDLVKHGDAPATAHVLYARILLRTGDLPNAVAQYKLGLELDPACEDTSLSLQLGVAADSNSSVFEARVREYAHPPEDAPDYELERPKLTFRDVGGMDDLKEEISMKIIYPLQHPEMFKAYGKPIGGGILMYGPPGCGKTYLARATAGEIKASFLAIGINDVLEMWVGSSERNLRSIFEQARSNRPCVLFFDEVDALGGRRADVQSGAGRNIINQFLSEMDGVEGNNDGLLVLAATNAPWHVDAAFRRPGRFDRVLFVPPPDQAGRAAILQLHCLGKPSEAIDFDQLAKKSEGFSGADLKAIVDQAVEGKLREAFKTGKPLPLTTRDLLAAAKSLKPTTREWFSTARNYALYSNQGGIYDDVLKYLKM